jgi:hypothetical protein
MDSDLSHDALDRLADLESRVSILEGGGTQSAPAEGVVFEQEDEE